jgi:hypothetical protein
MEQIVLTQRLQITVLSMNRVPVRNFTIVFITKTNVLQEPVLISIIPMRYVEIFMTIKVIFNIVRK